MATLLLVLLPIALLDATSITPLCMVPLILLMSGPRALVTSLAFLLGIFVSYVLSMVLVLLGLQSLLDVVTGFFQQLWNHPDTLDIWLGIAIGLVMMIFGARLADSREGGDDAFFVGDIGRVEAQYSRWTDMLVMRTFYANEVAERKMSE